MVSMFQFLAGICLKKTIFVKEKYFWEIESFKFFGIFWFDLDQAHIKINKKFIFYQQSVFSIIIALFCALSYKHHNKQFCWEYIFVIYQKNAWIPHLTSFRFHEFFMVFQTLWKLYFIIKKNNFGWFINIKFYQHNSPSKYIRSIPWDYEYFLQGDISWRRIGLDLQ